MVADLERNVSSNSDAVDGDEDIGGPEDEIRLDLDVWDCKCAF